jgi:TonB family protein
MLVLLLAACFSVVGQTPTPTPSKTPEQQATPSPTPTPLGSLLARPGTYARGGVEILSDRMGVDFDPYLKRMRVIVQQYWEPLVPKVALPPTRKSGTVILEFSIIQDGSVRGLKVAQSSGDPSLDRAAHGAILNASPLPHLPMEYTPAFVRIRCSFSYNPGNNPKPTPAPAK